MSGMGMTRADAIELDILRACVERHRDLAASPTHSAQSDSGVDIRPIVDAHHARTMSAKELNYEAKLWVTRLTTPRIGSLLRRGRERYRVRAYVDPIRDPPDPAWRRLNDLERILMNSATSSNTSHPQQNAVARRNYPDAAAITVAVIVPLREEFEQLELVMPRKAGFLGRNDLHEMQSPDPRLRIVAGVIFEPGVAAATAMASKMVKACAPAILICGGIAGGVHDVKSGDVVVAEEILHFDANRKIGPEGEEFSGYSWRAKSDLISELRNFQTSMKQDFLKWQSTCRGPDLERCSIMPSMHIGKIASGDAVIASSSYRENTLRQRDRKLFAVEMEGAGVARIAHEHELPWLVIRGVSDMSDENKAEHDKNVHGRSRAGPAYNAFALLEQVIRSGILHTVLAPRFPANVTAEEPRQIIGAPLTQTDSTESARSTSFVADFDNSHSFFASE